MDAEGSPLFQEPLFHDQMERDAFGHWLSGFVDGEGYFCLNSQKRAWRTRPTPNAIFGITVRVDDMPIMLKISRYFGCGKFQFRKSQRPTDAATVEWKAISHADLANVVIPHFDSYPLRAKKAKDYAIWKKGVQILHRPGLLKARYTDDEYQRFMDLRALLLNQRHCPAAIFSLGEKPGDMSHVA
jgi:hypothetical protein